MLPPRLLIVTPSLGGGGAERHMLRILPALQTAFDVEVATLRPGGVLESELPAVLPLHQVRSLGWTRAALRLRRIVGRRRPALALGFQEAANIPLLLALRTLRQGSRPAVAVSTQSAPSVVLADARPRTRARVRAAIGWLYPGADRLIVAADGVRRDLEDLAPASVERIQVIHNAGIDAGLAARAAEPCGHRFLSDRVPLLVACGRLTEQKDYPTLFNAVARLAKRRDVRLVVLGDGPLGDRLERLARDLAVADIVDLAGYAPNPYPCMARATVFVLSSRSEGFGNVLAEALALGVPIVSTDCPYGPGEILDRGRYGILVPPGDPAALADALDRLLGDETSRRRFAEQGPARAAAFSAERSGAAYVAMLEALLESRAPR